MAELNYYTDLNRDAVHAEFQIIANHFNDCVTKLNTMTPINTGDSATINSMVNGFNALRDAHLNLDDSLELALIRIRRLEDLCSQLQDADYNDIIGGGGGTPSGDDLTPPVMGTPSVDGVTLTIPYDEALDTTSIPSPTAFSGRKVVNGSTSDLVITNVEMSGSVVTLTLSEPVPHGATCDITYISATAKQIKDIAGNIAPTATQVPTTVNTANTPTVDTTPPTLVSTAPTNNALNQGVNTLIVLVFDEPVKAGTGSIRLVNQSDSIGDTRTIAITDTSQVTIGGSSSVQINPTNDLNHGVTYSVEIDATAILDESDNAYTHTPFSFGTEVATTPDSDAPTLSDFTPPTGATGVELEITPTLTFNEAVKAGSGAIRITNPSDATDTRVIDITDTSQIAISGSTVTITPTNALLNEVTYSLTVDAGAILDLNDNAFGGISSPTQITFTTVTAGMGGGHPWDGGDWIDQGEL